MGQTPAKDANPANDGSLGEFTLDATIIAPISQCWALYANASYMRLTASPGNPVLSIEDAYSIAFGLTFYPGGNARTRYGGRQLLDALSAGGQQRHSSSWTQLSSFPRWVSLHHPRGPVRDAGPRDAGRSHPLS